jgi:UDP-N-acetylmuramate--alanine ligase
LLRLPRRRLERVVDTARLAVVSDYAHHPTEIAATIRTLSDGGRRMLAVFQPHRYTRTRALRADFPRAFRGLDRLVLTPVYAASEPPLEGGTVWDLYREFRQAQRDGAGDVPATILAASLEQAWGYLRGEVRAGDALLAIGAGSVERVAAWAAAAGDRPACVYPLEDLSGELGATRVTRDEPLAGKTTLRVGGSADLWAAVQGGEDLAALRRWARRHELPFRILGAGSNVLVSDCGLRGLTVRLAGAEFRRILADAGGERRVEAGGAVPLARLLDRLQEQGLGGMEFLEGIPGTVGGAVRMNAGAGGSATADRLAWARVVRTDGELETLTPAQLEAGYRTCPGLKDGIVVAAAFDLDRVTPATVQERRASVGAGRTSWTVPTAGSIFRNPPGDTAGRLLDAAGFKGLRVGGAVVSPRHANVIVTEPGALASDVKALLELMRAGVQARYGLALENEVVELG